MSIQTIKLKHDITDFESLRELQKSQHMISNLAYNRKQDDMSEIEIRHWLKTKNIHIQDTWLIQSAIRRGISEFEQDKNSKIKRIFGSKALWKQRATGKISNNEYQEQKLRPLIIQGETSKNGNRKFRLDIEHNVIVFKISKHNHVVINIPKISKNHKLLLTTLQKQAELKENCFQIQIDTQYVYISFEQKQTVCKTIHGRSAGIDLNPNYFGFVITEHDKIIYQQIFDFTQLNKSTNTNKIKHEKIQACKQIHALLVHYQVSKLCLEDLKIKSKQHSKGTLFNKLVNNKWHRKLQTEQLIKRCNISGICVKLINPCYSSFVGNLLHKLPDALSSALEICRRGSKKSSGFYPKLICVENLANRWKEAPNWKYQNWKELYAIFKSENLMKEYRIPMTSKDLGYKQFISSTTMVEKYECYEHSYFCM